MDEPIAIGAGCGADPSFGATSRGMGALTLKMNSTARLCYPACFPPRDSDRWRVAGAETTVSSQSRQAAAAAAAAPAAAVVDNTWGPLREQGRDGPKSLSRNRTAREG